MGERSQNILLWVVSIDALKQEKDETRDVIIESLKLIFQKVIW